MAQTWQSIADQFMNARQEPDSRGERWFMRARRGDDGRWDFGKSNPFEELRFRDLARLAMARLGEPVAGDVASDMWLDRVLELTQKAKRDETHGRSLHGVFELSAELCHHLHVADQLKTITTGAVQVSRGDWMTRELRKKKWTTGTLATQAGSDQRTIEGFINGKEVRPSVLQRIANALEVAVTDIPSNSTNSTNSTR